MEGHGWRWANASSGRSRCSLRPRTCRVRTAIRSIRSSTRCWPRPNSTAGSKAAAGGITSRKRQRGKPSIPPGVYFRMLLVGYFEGIDSQRGIAWRCADSLSLRAFLGVPLDEATPDHSTMSVTRKRLPPEVFDEVFQFVLAIADEKRLLGRQNGGRRQHDAGGQRGHEEHRAARHGRGLAAVRHAADARGRHDRAGRRSPATKRLRRFDKKRKKTVSNDEWVSPTDPDAGSPR